LFNRINVVENNLNAIVNSLKSAKETSDLNKDADKAAESPEAEEQHACKAN